MQETLHLLHTQPRSICHGNTSKTVLFIRRKMHLSRQVDVLLSFPAVKSPQTLKMRIPSQMHAADPRPADSDGFELLDHVTETYQCRTSDSLYFTVHHMPPRQPKLADSSRFRSWKNYLLDRETITKILDIGCMFVFVFVTVNHIWQYYV